MAYLDPTICSCPRPPKLPAHPHLLDTDGKKARALSGQQVKDILATLPGQSDNYLLGYELQPLKRDIKDEDGMLLDQGLDQTDCRKKELKEDNCQLELRYRAKWYFQCVQTTLCHHACTLTMYQGKHYIDQHNCRYPDRWTVILCE
jgi:hypothetical protein